MSNGRRVTPVIGDPRNIKTESFKRPDHPDFWDIKQLRDNEFSGVRKNDIGLQWEFWILGEMVRTVSYEETAKDQFALTRAHCDVFYMTPEPGLFKR